MQTAINLKAAPDLLESLDKKEVDRNIEVLCDFLQQIIDGQTAIAFRIAKIEERLEIDNGLEEFKRPPSIIDTVINAMIPGESMSSHEIFKIVAKEITDITERQVSSALTQLSHSGKIQKIRKAIYRLDVQIIKEA